MKTYQPFRLNHSWHSVSNLYFIKIKKNSVKITLIKRSKMIINQLTFILQGNKFRMCEKFVGSFV